MGKTITWILVADGARARLFANDGPGQGPRQPMTAEVNKDLTKLLVQGLSRHLEGVMVP